MNKYILIGALALAFALHGCKSEIGTSCQNFPPPSFCPGGAEDIITIGTDLNGCAIYGCKTPEVQSSCQNFPPPSFCPGGIDDIIVTGVDENGCQTYGCSSEAVGGQRDEHGCLYPAGYSYSEDIGACVRTWEIDDEGKSRAAKAAVDYVVDNDVMDRFALTVTGFDVMRCGDAPTRCVGGYNVYLERTYDTIERKIVHLGNWEVTSVEDNIE